MKQLFLSLLLIPALSKAQVDSSHGMPMINKEVIYTEVVRVDSVSANELYLRAKRFFVDTYRSAQNVIQLDDEKNGEIAGKGSMEVYYDRGILIGGVTTHVRHTISIYVKDGRYKYEIKDFIVEYYQSGSHIGSSYISGSDQSTPIEGFVLSKARVQKRYAQTVDLHVRELIASLKEAMKTKAANDF